MKKLLTLKLSSCIAIISILSACGGTSNSIPENKYLSNKLYGITHFDPAQSDSIPYELNKGIFKYDLKKESQVNGGPINIMTLASTSPDYMWGVSTQGVTYINVKDEKIEEIARYDIPEIKAISKEDHEKMLRKDYKSVSEIETSMKKIYKIDMSRMFGGLYSVADKDNIVYVNFNKNLIYAFALKDVKDPTVGIKMIHEFDASSYLATGEALSGLSMTYEGKLILNGNHSLAIIDREFKEKPVIIRFDKDEYISNSVAVDEKNGIYVASDKYMRKIVWTGKELSQKESDGAWKTEYTIGQQPPAIKFGKGTGATPTLMGFGDDEDKLVVITDGANRMNLVAFWRDGIPSGFKQKDGTKSNRIADQISIGAGRPQSAKWIQTEQSVVVKGYGAFVVQNIIDKSPKDRLVGVIATGPIITPPLGCERLEWNVKENKWESIWARGDVSSISMVPAVSIGSNMVLVNGYYKDRGWEVTGLDWDNGTTVHQTQFGYDNFGNGAYAIIQIMEDGDMLFNSIAGPIRLQH